MMTYLPDLFVPIKNKSIAEEVSEINIHRIKYLFLIMVVVHVAHILIFVYSDQAGKSETVLLWRDGIIYAHLVMAILITLFGIGAFMISRKNMVSSMISRIFQSIVIFSYLLFGVAVSLIDQLVTSNIMPFFVASVGIAVTFLIRPIFVLIYYAITFLVFYYTVDLMQTSSELLLSVRVNSITATGISVGIALVLWRNNIKSIQQKNQIEEQQEKLKDSNRQLQYLATHDPLTGLINREQFMQTVEREIVSIQNNEKETSMVIMDIDYFKNINDHYGHPVGDRILKEVADFIKEVLRRTDIPARLGGEEFIILLPDTSLSEGNRVAEKLQQKLQDHSFSIDGVDHKITASFGVASLTHCHHSFQECYSEADKALYRAKNNGRNCVEIAIPESQRS